MLEGIDVSHYQATTPSLAGRAFCIVKATEGTARDPMVDEHVAAVRAAGKIPGLYHFTRSDVILTNQVDAFLEVAAELGIRWLAFDVEGAHAWSFATLRTGISIVHAAGEDVGLYASRSRFVDAGQDWDWVADWGPTPPSIPWDVWQYRGAPLDLDRFGGTLAELRILAKLEDPMKLAPLDYHQAIKVQPGKPVLDAPGGQRIYTTRAGEQFPEVGDTSGPAGSYHVMRMPGDIAGFIAHGSTLGSVPLPQPDPPDCSLLEHQLELANGRIRQAITALGGTPT